MKSNSQDGQVVDIHTKMNVVVKLSSNQRTIKIPALDITMDGARLRFPVPQPFLNQDLELCVLVKTDQGDDTIVCGGRVADHSQGRNLVFSELPELAQAFLKKIIAENAA